MERKLNDKNYIAIADWMISDFDFNTKELLCYAIIYGFSQDGESVFSGSLNYLSTWLGVRRDNVLRYLNGLVEKGVITKEKKSSAAKSWCEYRVVENKGAARNSDHIVISPWMINDLGLKDKELILYALIHGFSRVGSNSVFSGNNSYMGKWLGVNKANVNRYTSSLIEKGLIERIEEEGSIKYRAIVPNRQNNTPNHFEYTLINDDEEGNQNEYTPNQIENKGNHIEESGLINLSTNNISLNNLKNNINHILNNNNVVDEINLEITESDLSEKEKELLNIKNQNDLAFFKKYKNKALDIIKVLKAISMQDFRRYLVYNKPDPNALKAKELLIKTLALKRYEKYVDKINSLSDSEFNSLLFEAFSIYDDDLKFDKNIRKSPEAYFIGIVDNVLDVNK